MTTYGSDVAIQALAGLGIDTVAYNPGASFRGLHESLVHLGVQRQVLCLAEGVAVAAAHGYAKASGRPMGVFLHNLVGLQAGSMAIFNAWIDQVPMVVVGGSGPADRETRRPWIDWIHTASPQGAIVRDWVKWDHEPTSLPGFLSALRRGHERAMAQPQGPVYLSFDAGLQEAEVVPPDLTGYAAHQPSRMSVPSDDLERVADALVAARRPVLVADLVGRSRSGYDALTTLSELTGARVVDLGGRHNFPTTHPHDATAHRSAVLAEADLVVLLDVRDPGWALCAVDPSDRSASSLLPPGCEVVDFSLASLRGGGFLEPQGDEPRASTRLVADTGVVLPAMVDHLHATGATPTSLEPLHGPEGRAVRSQGPIDDDTLARMSHDALRGGPWQLAHGLLRGAVRRHWRLDRFGAHLGGSGGAGLGYGVGASVGAALAAPEDQVTVALQPDGDLLYTASGLWTAAHEELPLLVLVVNNRRYAQDHMHQSIMSRTRGRPAAHATIGIDLEDPAVDFARLAESQGVEAAGPVGDVAELRATLDRAVRVVREERRPFLVDVEVAR